MTIAKEQIEIALREGIPFSIKMADGPEYRVDNSNQVHIADTHLIFADQRTLAHMLPLLTITGVSYLKASKKKT
jgi:hypothetical protein